MLHPSSPHVSRRKFLVGGGAAVAGAALLGACGSDGTVAPTSTTDEGSLSLVQFFGGLPMLAAGSELRAPFGLADKDGLLPVERTPKVLTVQVHDPTGKRHGAPIVIERRAQGLQRAYFPLEVTLDEPGVYSVRTEVEGKAAELTMKVDAPGDIKVIQVGQPMPDIETPSVADGRGVQPICTRDPVCPLHDASVASLLAGSEPFGLLVASPAFCQIVICGPVLEVLLEVRDQHPSVRFVHAEVFVDPAKDQDTYAPVVGALGLHYEPALVLVGTDGTVADRIDTIYDRSELGERLARLG